jgi:hypothetical protein
MSALSDSKREQWKKHEDAARQMGVVGGWCVDASPPVGYVVGVLLCASIRPRWRSGMRVCGGHHLEPPPERFLLSLSLTVV